MMLLAAVVLSLVGYGAFSLTSSFWAACALMVIGGAGGGTIEVVINAVVLKLSETRRSNLLNFIHLFFGVGAFIGPAVVGKLMALGVSWNWFYYGTAICWAVLLLGTLACRFPSIKPAATSTSEPAQSVFSLPLARVLFLVLTVYVGLELGVGGWITTYLNLGLEMNASHAAYAASAFWLGIALGRLLLGIVGHRWHESVILTALAAFSVICLIAALFVPSPYVVAMFLALTGLGYSGIYPTTVSLGGGAYPEQSTRVTALLVTGGGIGSVLFPWIMGYISEGFGLRGGMTFYIALNVILLGFVVYARKLSPTKATATA
jgi:fucose permease